MKRTRCVFIRPCCMLLVVVIRGLLRVAVAFGPTFSSQFWSIAWSAAVWPRDKDSLGAARWMRVG